MNLYLVTADRYSYNQYDKFVVWAESEADAVTLAESEPAYGPEVGAGTQIWTASLLTPPAKSGVVLGSYIAG